MKTFYMQLKPVVLSYVEMYKTDFTKYDKKILTRLWRKHRKSAKFILAIRKTGTNLYDYTTESEKLKNSKTESDIRERVGIYKMWIIGNNGYEWNDRFFHCENGEIKEISREDADLIIQKNPNGKVYA